MSDTLDNDDENDPLTGEEEELSMSPDMVPGLWPLERMYDLFLGASLTRVPAPPAGD